MVLKTMGIPDYFEAANDEELNPIRLLYNTKKWKYYHIVEYTDYYQAYLSPLHFKNSGRLDFDYDENIRLFVISKTFQKFKQHGQDELFTFSTIENHHTIRDWYVSHEPLPLILLYDKATVKVKIDEWLSVRRRWISDAN